MNEVICMLTLMRIPRANKTDVETPPRASFGIAQADARLLVSCLIKVIRPKGASKPPFKFRTAWLAMRIPSTSASTFATAPTSSPAVPARSSSSRGDCVSRSKGNGVVIYWGFQNRTHLPTLLIQRRRTAIRHPSANVRRGSAHRVTRARHGRRRRDHPTTRRMMTSRLRGAQSCGGRETCRGGISEGMVWGLYYTPVTSTCK
ncbi:hypothetical protein EDB89DRAFT_2048062 [Lactarius sanguifluus]|nr:hypothetical protein EDB89DRAFT_2048062 [Lactarius sanguifluus]